MRPKSPNNRPDKGWTKELQSKPQTPAKGKKDFSWNKPVVKPAAPITLATPHRLENNRSVKKAVQEFAKQTIEHRENLKKK